MDKLTPAMLNLTVAQSSAGFVDANFPKDDEGRTYHVGTARGSTANRIITVGEPTRALQIASNLDEAPKPFAFTSKRGFTTITGRYKGVPVSIISIGMGGPNMDFFVREVREIVDGPLAIIRLGTCGCIGSLEKTGTSGDASATTSSTADHRCGMVAVADNCIRVARNYDYFLDAEGEPYLISKPIQADPQLLQKLESSLESALGKDNVLVGLNAAADSFYGSQARTDPNCFDANDNLLRDVRRRYPDILTFEMESYELFSFGLVCLGKNVRGSHKSVIEKRKNGELKPTVFAAAAHIIVGGLLAFYQPGLC